MCDVDQVNCEGYTLMHSAAFNGEINVVQFLLESGADMARRTPQGNTPLSKAVDRNQVSLSVVKHASGPYIRNQVSLSVVNHASGPYMRNQVSLPVINGP